MTRTTPELAPPFSPNSRTTLTAGRLAPYVLFNLQQAECTTDLRWNWVSNLETSSLNLTIRPPRPPHRERKKEAYSLVSI
ncbi:hypothetical protein AVEN_5226-1 [Araneus ventricosus]|uniref:Uncharacterized protein n=1 Tax=Araneus ventricosus TaxID=182803 RepID=A0A4Y2I167_ARAVE|nr:hypothetical protein AVEN_5226-1 [Araneus ventricosus]